LDVVIVVGHDGSDRRLQAPCDVGAPVVVATVFLEGIS